MREVLADGGVVRRLLWGTPIASIISGMPLYWVIHGFIVRSWGISGAVPQFAKTLYAPNLPFFMALTIVRPAVLLLSAYMSLSCGSVHAVAICCAVSLLSVPREAHVWQKGVSLLPCLCRRSRPRHALCRTCTASLTCFHGNAPLCVRKMFDSVGRKEVAACTHDCAVAVVLLSACILCQILATFLRTLGNNMGPLLMLSLIHI